MLRRIGGRGTGDAFWTWSSALLEDLVAGSVSGVYLSGMTGTGDHCCCGSCRCWTSAGFNVELAAGAGSSVVLVVVVRISRPGCDGRWKRSVMDPADVLKPNQ